MTTATTGRRAANTSSRTAGSDGRARVGGTSRRYGQWAGTILFIVLVALAAGFLWVQKGHQTDVLAVTKAVPAGATLTRDDVESVSVSGVSGAIAASSLDAAVGKTLVVGLTPGQIVTSGVLTSSPVPAPGMKVVSALLSPGRLPVGVSSGDLVDVLVAPAAASATAPAGALTNPQVLVSGAQVLSVGATSASSSGSGTLVSLLVPQAAANQVAEYAAVGQVVMVQVPLGGGH